VWVPSRPGFFEKNGLQAAPELREVLKKQSILARRPGTSRRPWMHRWLALAQALRVAGLAGAWRDELLAVTDEQGTALGVVERAAVRPLGIATRAVHLLARSPDGRPLGAKAGPQQSPTTPACGTR
jgi:hypothetical protein